MKRAFAIGALIAATAAMSAGAQTIRGNTENDDRDEVIIAVSCADLRAEVAAARAECQPARPATAPAVRLTAFETDRPAAKQRRMTTLPWLIGVYN